jgi:hypothetical protein
MKLFLQLAKVDLEKRLVYGRATQEIIDRSGEMFDYATSKPHFEKWSGDTLAATKAAGTEASLGNVRAMHGKVAAGKLTEMHFDDVEKAIDVCAEIVDDAEWHKVKKGVYTGFSIGGSYVKRWTDEAGTRRFTAGPAELSIVDNPCVPTATFAMVKANGVEELTSFATVDGAEPDEEFAASTASDLVRLAKTDLEEEPKDIPVAELAPAAIAQADGAVTAPAAAVVESDAVVAARQALADAIAADEAAKTSKATLFKGMYNVGRLAEMLQSIAYMASSEESEKSWEKDASTVPDELRTWLAMGVEIFKKMSIEETAELIASVTPPADVTAPALEMAAGGDLEKAGARHSKADLDRLQAVHDHAVGMGASCSAAKMETGDLAKVSTLEKTVATLEGEKDALAKRVQELEALPEPAKGVVSAVAITKAGDSSDLEKTGATVELPNPETHPKEFSLAVMKLALAKPQ